MSVVYVTSHGSTIGYEQDRIVITDKDNCKRLIPIETVEGITLLSMSQLTTSCIEQCLQRGITVTFLSKGGRYFGRLVSTGHVNAELQRKQSVLYNTDFSIQLSKRLLSAKMRNQLTVMRRYAREKCVDISDEIAKIKSCEQHIQSCSTIPQVMGYEGTAAKVYFSGLDKCIDTDFHFKGRSRRPPMDEFNSLISLGYSILMNEIYSEIEVKGLNPYFGFMHQDREKHPTLASDLIEEWRAVLVDSLAMSLINGHEIQKDHFEKNVDEPGCFLTHEGLKIFMNKFEEKMKTRNRYLDYIEDRTTFRTAVAYQIGRLSEAIQHEDVSCYKPIIVR